MPEESTLTEHAIQALVLKARESDTVAFEELYNHFFKPVYRYCAFRLPKEIAEDVTADVFVKVWENLPKYQPHPKIPFGAWLFRIVRNQIVDVYRKEPTMGEMPEDVADHDMFNRADHSTKHKELVNVMKVAMDQLPSRYREILLLSFVSELPTHEVARVLKMTEGSVRILKHRALKKLETYLPPDLPFNA